MIAQALLRRLCEAEEWSSLQANLPPGLASDVLAIGRKLVTDSDLGPDGREAAPHVTVKYGFDAKDLPPEMRQLLENTEPFSCKIGELNAFYGDQDVLHFEVVSPRLRSLNAAVGQFKHHDTFPTYNPHVTVAYLRSGLAAPLLGPALLTGKDWLVSSVEFSSSDGSKERVQLGRRGNRRS